MELLIKWLQIKCIVCRVYFAPIIGAKGKTKKQMEEDTNTIIKVPRNPSERDICEFK